MTDHLSITVLIPEAVGYLSVKSAAELSYGLSGRLYLSKSGWLLLSVPNAFLRGCFNALSAPGVELPRHSDGSLNAHISVMHSSEVDSIGAENISERGKLFRYTLGKTREVNPKGWDGVERCWFVEAHSPELEKLRKSYGLSALPNDGKHKFHITFAVRKKNVLKNNETKKADSIPALQKLILAKTESDRKNYEAKHRILRELINQYPEEFVIDDDSGKYQGITHTPTKFKIHGPRSVTQKIKTNTGAMYE